MLSTNPLTLALVGLFITGAIIFVIGTMLTRETQAEAEPIVDIATRMDTVERLAIVGQPWCVEQLDKIRREDPVDSVREAADAALTVIGARLSKVTL